MRRLQTQFVFLFLIATYSQVLLAADLEALPEFLRSDPFGAIVVDTSPFIWLSSRSHQVPTR